MMTYLGVNPYGEHGFRLDDASRADPLYGREVAAWCIAQFGTMGKIPKKNRYVAAIARERADYWYCDENYGEKHIGLFFFKRECDAFAFKMRWA